MPLKHKNKDLPPNMLRRIRGNWQGYYYSKRVNGKRIEIPLGSSLNLALEKYNAIDVDELFNPTIDWDKELAKLLSRTKKRALAKNIPFNLTKSDIQNRFEFSDKRCQLSGIKFSDSIQPNVRFRPWMPSIDRIDPFGPYSIENTRLICSYVNIAINQFGEKQLLEVARKINRNLEQNS